MLGSKWNHHKAKSWVSKYVLYREMCIQNERVDYWNYSFSYWIPDKRKDLDIGDFFERDFRTLLRALRVHVWIRKNGRNIQINELIKFLMWWGGKPYTCGTPETCSRVCIVRLKAPLFSEGKSEDEYMLTMALDKTGPCSQLTMKKSWGCARNPSSALNLLVFCVLRTGNWISWAAARGTYRLSRAHIWPQILKFIVCKDVTILEQLVVSFRSRVNFIWCS